MQGKKQQFEPYIEQLTSSKLGKEYIKTVYCHSAYLTSMQGTSYEMPGWMESIFVSLDSTPVSQEGSSRPPLHFFETSI